MSRLSSATVRNTLRANVEVVKKKLEDLDELSKEEKGELKIHTAGAVAKLAYKIVKEQQVDDSIKKISPE